MNVPENCQVFEWIRMLPELLLQLLKGWDRSGVLVDELLFCGQLGVR